MTITLSKHQTLDVDIRKVYLESFMPFYRSIVHMIGSEGNNFEPRQLRRTYNDCEHNYRMKLKSMELEHELLDNEFSPKHLTRLKECEHKTIGIFNAIYSMNATIGLFDDKKLPSGTKLPYDAPYVLTAQEYETIRHEIEECRAQIKNNLCILLVAPIPLDDRYISHRSD